MELEIINERSIALAHNRQRTWIVLVLTLLLAASIFVLVFRAIRKEMVVRGEADQSEEADFNARTPAPDQSAQGSACEDAVAKVLVITIRLIDHC